MASAQEESTSKFFTIGVNPTMLLEPTTPSLGISMEHTIINSLTLELTYGLDLNWEPIFNYHPAPNFRHHEYKVYLKYYFNDYFYGKEFTNATSFYAGVDYFGIRNTFERTNSTFQENSITYSYDQSSVNRKVNGFRINLGFKFAWGRHIYIDTYAGIGSRIINIKHTPINKVEVGPNIITALELLAPIDKRAGVRRASAVSFGFNIAYRIFRDLPN